MRRIGPFFGVTSFDIAKTLLYSTNSENMYQKKIFLNKLCDYYVLDHKIEKRQDCLTCACSKQQS